MLCIPTADHQDGLINRMVQRWHAFRERRDSLAGLERCGSGEAARIAYDLAVSPSELRVLARNGAGAADLMYRRIDDLGLDRDLIARDEPSVLRDMQKVCCLCASKGRCRHDFACGAQASAWHPYCPNDDTLAALLAGGAHRIGCGGASVRSLAIRDGRSDAHGPALGVLLITLAWLAVLVVPPATRDNSAFAPIAPPQPAIAAPAPAVDCLDASCLTAQQHSALRDLRTVQAQGFIASSAEQIASLPRVATLAQSVRSGEALACRRAGGATYYGFMFQSGCSTGGTSAARLDGFKECRPMAGGGVCLLQ